MVLVDCHALSCAKARNDGERAVLKKSGFYGRGAKLARICYDCRFS